MRSRARPISMDGALTTPWTAREFLAWAAKQEERYEFDGQRPVAMIGGTARHNRISHNIYLALGTRLRGKRCTAYGPDLGVQTIGEKVRFPDTLITCTKFPDTEQLAPDVVIVFEVISGDSGRRDRIEKMREYAAVPSIRRYVIVESADKGLPVLHRRQGSTAFTASALTEDDTLDLPEVGITVPVAELYEDVAFAEGIATT